jgi:hypothetical protein
MIRSSGRAAWMLALACAVVPVKASRAYEVCRASCAPADLGCRAALALCETKLRGFDFYMAQIDTGGPRYELPLVYRDILRPHYPRLDFERIRFSFSDQQPPDNATTDCDQIYFNDAAHVETLRSAGPNPKWLWLLHELTHAEQCALGGGREKYALRWWGELETAVRESGETIDVFQTTEQLAKQLQALYVRVHAAMPMEQAADAKAEAVLADLRSCCIAPDGTLVRPAP